MPRSKSTDIPAYRHHKPSGRATVRLDGKDCYLGVHGTDKSRAEYDRVISEWMANGRRLPHAQQDTIEVNELILSYLRFARGYYVKNGEATSEVDAITAAVRPLSRLYGETPAADFGPLALKAVRQQMIRRGLCRNTVNQQISRVKRLFRWAVENELVPGPVYQALAAVRGLARGRTEARETRPVTPVPDHLVDPVLPLVASPVRAMIELQRLTGMRACEVVIMRGRDVDATGRLWVYRPESHKTAHHGKTRIIELGPQAQEIVGRFFKPDLEAYLFSPADAEREHRDRRRSARVTPDSCGNRPGTNRRRKPKRQPGDRYTTNSYRRAITRACEQAFPPPDRLARRRVKAKKGQRLETDAEWEKRLGPDRWDELQAWQREHQWTPHRLRHNFATRVRKEHGLEAARILLGHASMATSEIYAELDLEKVRSIVAASG